MSNRASLAPLSREALLTLLLAAAWIGIWGYSFAGGNQVIYIPQILNRIDPTLFEADWFVQTDNTHRFMFSLAAALENLFGLGGAILLLHFLNAAVLISAMRFLARVLSPKAAVFWLLLILVLQSHRLALGGNPLWGIFWQPHFAAVAAGLWVAALWISGRTVLAYLTAGLLFYIHVSMGGALSLVLFVLGLAGARRIGWRRLIAGWSIGALVAAGAVLPVLLEQIGGMSEAGHEQIMMNLADIRHPHHHVPSAWKGIFYVRFLGLLAAAAFAFWRIEASEKTRELMRFILVVLVFCIVATIAVEWIPVPVVAELHFFRLTILAKVLACGLVAVWLFSMLRSGNPARMAAAGLVLLVYSEEWRLAAIAAAAAVDLLRPLGAGAPSSAIGRASAFLSRRLDKRAFVLFLLVLLIHAYEPATTDRDTHFIFGVPAKTPWEKTCAWVRANTPKGDVFIAPPYVSDFRLRARRPIIADFKGFPFNERGMLEWERRLSALAGAERMECRGHRNCIRWMKEGYQGLDAEAFLELAERFDARWLVTEDGKPLPFEVVHENGPFRVWRIPREEPSLS